ncbi:MAG: S8 family serine peptidase [Patescibacteria group bacterium]
MKKLMGRYLAAFLILGLAFGPFSVIADEEPAFEPPQEAEAVEMTPPVIVDEPVPVADATSTPPIEPGEPAAEAAIEEASVPVEAAPEFTEPVEAIAPIDPDTYVPGEVIVKFKEQHIDLEEEQGVEESEALIEKLDLTTENLIEGQNVAVLGTETSIERTIALLEANPEVEYAEPNYIRTVDVATTDTHITKQWALDNIGQIFATDASGTADADIDAPEAWALSKGTGIVIAVIDTGIDYEHPDLMDNMWDGSACIASSTPLGGCIHGYDFYEQDVNPEQAGDQELHGTHVSGIIAAEMNNSMGVAGVAPEAKIMALRVGTTTFSTSAIVRAINFATENGADIINASYSGAGFSDAEKAAMQRFEDAGGIFVTAAANSGNDIDSTPAYPASYDLASIISVAATDENDNLAEFSNYGEESVDIGAPGNSILSTIPAGYGYLDGTSMATPHVAGVAALVKSYQPSFTAAQIKAALLDTGDALDGLCEKTVSGKRLNAHNALLGSTTPVCDIQPPSISLNGPDPLTLTIGDTFVDPGVTVIDNLDPSPSMIVTGSVDTSSATTMILIYTATDANSNSASTTRTVVVSAAAPPPVSSGGGGGGGGGGGSTKKKSEPAKPVVKPKVTPKLVPMPEPSVPRFPQAEVLGASTSYTFTLTLSLGSTGQEVTELQKKLKELGFFSGEATGYFGPLTETAVKAFQSSKGLAPVGTVGPETRAALNGTVSLPASTDIASLKAQIAVLQAQLALLLAQVKK